MGRGRGGGRGVWIPPKMMTSFMWTATNQPFQSNKMVQKIKDLPCIRFIITVDHYCFVCLFGALVFVSRILANLCGFFVCWMKFPSDLAMISLLSVINICVWPALYLKGRPRGAGPHPGTLKVRLAKEDIYNAAMFCLTFTKSSSHKIMHLRFHG